MSPTTRPALHRPTCLALLALFLPLAPATAQQDGPAPAEPWPNLQQVIVVSKTHFDIGFTAMASQVIQRYRTSMIDNALDIIDQSNTLPPDQQFKWTLAAWPLAQILADWPGQTDQRRARLEQALRAGRLVPHALPFTTHTSMNEPETLVRGLGWASRICHRYDLPLPRAAKMTDVPSHSWIIPTLLHHAGVRFLHLGCNPGSSSPKVPLLFWWQGPDGSRLLTMYVPTGYGTGPIPPKDWPHKTWLAMWMTGDNHGPPRAEQVRQVFEQARKQLPSRVTIRFGRLEDFADAILAENPDLPVVRGDMPDTWIHGPMANPRGVRLSRNIVPRIAAAETLHSLLAAWNRAPHPDRAADTIGLAYEQALLYGEHTWGGTMGWFGRKIDYGEQWKKAYASGKYRRNEASWEEHTDYIRHARGLIMPLLQAELASLADAVNAPATRIVVFNPLPWKRHDRVDLPHGLDPAVAIKDAQTGRPCPIDPSGRSFIARDVPPFGWRTYLVQAPAQAQPAAPAAAPADPSQPLVVESRFFKATLDPQRGVVASLLDKTSGRQLVDSSAPHGLGQFLYERFSSNETQRWADQYIKVKANWAQTGIGKTGLPPAEQVPYSIAWPQGFTVSVSRRPGIVTATLHAPAGQGVPCAVTLTLSLYDDLPWADLALTLHDKPADSWPEGGWLALPLKVDSPRFQLGRLGGIVDPAADIVPGSNHEMLWLNSGMAVLGPQGHGVGLCPIDSPLVSLGRPGLWRHSPERRFTSPWVYVNLFNNQWSTNFRLWNSGTWTSRIRLWAIDDYEPAGDLIAPAWQARSALLAAASSAEPGPLPAQLAGLQLSRQGVLVTAFGPNPDGPGRVLRLWEQAARSGPCTITLTPAVKIKTVQPIDLRGRPVGQAFHPADNTWTVNLQANAPVSFQLNP